MCANKGGVFQIVFSFCASKVMNFGPNFCVSKGMGIFIFVPIQITICPFYWNNITKLDML